MYRFKKRIQNGITFEDLFYHKYRSSVARLRIFAHFFPTETERMMNKPKEQKMCPFWLSKQIGGEHHYILKYTHPKLILIGSKPFEVIFKLADLDTYNL